MKKNLEVKPYIGVKLLKSYIRPIEDISKEALLDETDTIYYFSNDYEIEVALCEYVAVETRKGISVGSAVDISGELPEGLKLVPLKNVLGVIKSSYFENEVNRKVEALNKHLLLEKMAEVKKQITFQDEVNRIAELSPEFKQLAEELGFLK